MSSPRVPSNGAGIDLDKQALMSASPRPGTSSPRPGKVEEISTRDQVLPIMAYCAASIMMTVVNKFVVSGNQFTMTFLILSIQSAVCVLVVTTLKRLGIITFRELSVVDAKAWFPVSSLLVAVIYTGSKALQFLSVPVYTIFKNLAIILTAYGEFLMFGNSVTGLTLVAFALMVGSSVIAAWASGVDPNDHRSSSVGYIWMALNCFASAAYVLYMRKRIKITGFKDWDSMFYNNLLSIPVLVVASIVIEDWGTKSLIQNFPPENRVILLSAITFSGAAAVLISYSTAWCVRVCGSTTYSMVGALNKLPVAASGMLFFGDPASFGNVSAIGVGGVAGIVYAVAKTNQARVERARQEAGGRV